MKCAYCKEMENPVCDYIEYRNSYGRILRIPKVRPMNFINQPIGCTCKIATLPHLYMNDEEDKKWQGFQEYINSLTLDDAELIELEDLDRYTTEYATDDFIPKTNCQCGGASTTNTHSHWCPAYKG